MDQFDAIDLPRLHVGPDGVLRGHLPAAELTAGTVPRILVLCEGERWAEVPGRPEGSAVEFECALPLASTARTLRLTARDAHSGRLLGECVVGPRPAPVSRNGILAADVFDPEAAPLWSFPWLEFNGASVIISGACLPPGGDPGALSIAPDETLSMTLDYPLPSPEFGAHYWYWPNAGWSAFRLTIDLAGSPALPWPLSFRLDFPYRDRDDEPAWADRGRVWVPQDFADYVNFPDDLDQLGRVQTWSTDRSVAFTGYSAFRTFESLLARHGMADRPGLALLDWGCGHGRVTRHFIRHWPQSQIHGSDIDAENIGWCQRRLRGGSFHVGPLWPAGGFGTASLDVVIGLSVMTHLVADAQEAWLAEIARILRPGGIAVLTFGGEGAAAFASIHHDPVWWRRLHDSGFDDAQIDPALHGKIADAAYYRTTHQLPFQVRQSWSRYFEILEIQSQAFGYQDAAILRPWPSPRL